MSPQPTRAVRDVRGRARALLLCVALSTAVSVGAALVPASPALAAAAHVPTAVSPAGCPPDADYTYTNVRYSHIQGPPYAQGGPGHTLSIALTAGVTLTATATITGSGSLSAIVAGARVDVSASLAVALSASITYADSWTVPSGVSQGYLAAGAASRQMSWSHGSYNGACQWLVDGRGTLNAPYHVPAFWSWTS